MDFPSPLNPGLPPPTFVEFACSLKPDEPLLLPLISN